MKTKLVVFKVIRKALQLALAVKMFEAVYDRLSTDTGKGFRVLL